jgi:hypothetical protein
VCAVAAAAAVAAPASASISVSSFSVSPSTTQAGQTSSTSGPNLHVVAAFSSATSDSPDNVTVALAPGLLQNPTVPAQCTPTQFYWDACPVNSWIGTGYVVGSAPGFFGFTAPLDANAYLVSPNPGEPARLGLIINIFGVPFESALAPITIRTTPGDVGENINFAGLPNSWHGLPLTLRKLDLTIFGTVFGRAFTRNPTSCGPAVSRLSAISYGSPSQTATASSSFTPTGCSSLPFSPGASASATLDTADSGVSYTTTFTQGTGEAGIASIALTTPPSLSPNIAVAAAGCTSPDLSTCPAVGAATLSSPFLSQPLSGRIVLVAHPLALPTPTIVFGPPVPLVVPGTDSLTSNPLALHATFDQLPDIPLSRLTVTFAGGPGSLFVAKASALCAPPQDTTGTIVAQSGASLSGSVATTVFGCPASTAAPASS